MDFLCYKIKKIITGSKGEDISLDLLSRKIGKTPNYLNYVFKEETGMTIHSYIIKEEVRIICELILSRSLSFKDACQAVAKCTHHTRQKNSLTKPFGFSWKSKITQKLLQEFVV